jgi:hypothetical protein
MLLAHAAIAIGRKRDRRNFNHGRAVSKTTGIPVKMKIA